MQTGNIVTGDWGGTNFRTAVMQYDGVNVRMLEGTYHEYQSEKEPGLETVLGETIGRTIDDFGREIDGIALGVAGPIGKHATVQTAANILSLKGKTPYPLREKLGKMFGGKNVVANDLEAALAGEVSKGVLQRIEWAMLANYGTGIGGAMLLNGQVMASEPGHVWMPGNGKPCGCGKTGCLETVLGGYAIRTRVVDVCDMRSISIPKDMHPCAFADQEALKGTQWAADLYADIANTVGQTWGSILNVCPLVESIVYTGSFLECAMQIEFFRKKVETVMKQERSVFPEHANVSIKPTGAPRLGAYSLGNLYGAEHIWRREYGDLRT